MAGSLAVGLGVAVAAAGCNAASVALQALEARRQPVERGPRLSLLERLAHRPRWLLGTALLVVAWPLQILALAFAPITVVQPMLSTSLLMLLGIGATALRERVDRWEVVGVLGVVGGIVGLVVAAPRDTLSHPDLALVIPTLVALAALSAAGQLVARWRTGLTLLVVLGVGLGYGCADFAGKLLADDAAAGQWAGAAAWLAGVLAVGALAFVGENFALQCRPAVEVAPIVAAFKVPVPVLLALAVGGEGWGPWSGGAVLLCLAALAAGATVVARSPAVHTLMGGGGRSEGADVRNRTP